MGVAWKKRQAAPSGDGTYTPEESLGELAELAASAGASVQARLLQTRETAEAATLIGAGKVRELKDTVSSTRADVVIFDQDLTPTQQRNLEKTLDIKVIDRTQLILDIFARHARTREGRLQVELAQLNYLLPRLTGMGAALSRLGGGIGTRGPGETKLETDRRRIARRIRKIERDLEGVRASRALHRKTRSAVPLPTMTLVGYTNAGKSTLFNRLTAAGVLVDARMFATLDPTVRIVTLPSRRRVLTSDTVGFIRNLPTTLVKAFRATLEEIAEATLILHVVDASSFHAPSQTAHVRKVLAEIGAAEIPQILVLNKMDLLPSPHSDSGALRHRLIGESGANDAPAVLVSARTGEGFDCLLAAIDQWLPFDPLSRVTLRFPADEGAKISLVHQFGRVRETTYAGEFCCLEAEIPQSLRAKLRSYIIETVQQ